MDLFWYTGYIVWFLASIIVGIAFLIGCTVGIAVAYRRGREWATVRALSALSGTTRAQRIAVVNAVRRARQNGRLGGMDAGDLARALSLCWTDEAIRMAMRPNARADLPGGKDIE